MPFWTGLQDSLLTVEAEVEGNTDTAAWYRWNCTAQGTADGKQEAENVTDQKNRISRGSGYSLAVGAEAPILYREQMLRLIRMDGRRSGFPLRIHAFEMKERFDDAE